MVQNARNVCRQDARAVTGRYAGLFHAQRGLTPPARLRGLSNTIIRSHGIKPHSYINSAVLKLRQLGDVSEQLPLK
jgi:hypothetical protein